MNEIEFKNQILNQLSETGFDISGIELEIIEFLDENHLNCLWYGGKVAKIKYKNYIFSLEAIGDVKCSLFDKNNNEIARLKDKNNMGNFYTVMSPYLKSDEDLSAAYNAGNLGVIKPDNDVYLDFEDNNWFEIFVTSPNGEFHDLMLVCESSDNLDEAIKETIDSMDEIIKYLEEDND